MQYIDSRNPFDVRTFLDDEKALEKLKSIHEESDLYYAGYDSAEEYMKDFGYGPSMTKDAYWNELKKLTDDPNNVLQELGYDSIQHPGGLVFDTEKHNVTIAFDPSQIYSPYIAPAIRNVPNPTREIAQLGAYLGLHPLQYLKK
jgi:hypothetical protein